MKSNTEKTSAAKAVDTNASKTNETNLQTIIVIGTCNGTYHNDDVSKEFSTKALALVRPDGSLVVQNLNGGIRPICYIGEGAEISLARDVIDAEIELIATTEDGQHLSLQFDEVYSLCGVPGEQNIDSLALTVLRCVNELAGKYGRVRIARLLTGSTSKCVLTMGIDELRAYGIARGVSQKEMINLIDWLIDESYLGFSEDDPYPTLTVTDKGMDTLEGSTNGKAPALKVINTTAEGEEFNHRVALLKEWRKFTAEQRDQPVYLVLQNRSVEELAVKNPTTVEELQTIYGIGEVKAQAYGEDILHILGNSGL